MAVVTADNLTAFTRDLERDELIDQVFTGNQLLFRMNSDNRVTEDGGTNVEFEVVVNTGVGGSYGDFDTLSTADQEFAIQATIPWKHYYEPVVISGIQRLKNMGRTRIINLLDAKREHAAMSLSDNIGTGLWSDGTGNSNKDLQGLRAMLSTSSTYENINPTTYTTWAASIDSTTNTLTLATIDDQITNQSIGAQTPTDIIGNKAVYNKIHGLVIGAERHNKPAFGSPGGAAEAMARAGFQVIEYQGIPVYYDEKSPGSGDTNTDNFLTFLNMKRLELVVHEMDNFELDDFRPAPDQRAMNSFWFWTGNFLTKERRVQGAMTTIDPAL